MPGLLRLLRIASHPRRHRADLVYEALGTRHNWSERSLFLNLGYWRHASCIDDASVALAHLVGERAALTPGDRVFTAGFGFGDELLHWMRHFGPLDIKGLDVSRSQVQHAQRRVLEAGFGEHVELVQGDAVSARYPDASFDKVLAVESAFHYRTRQRFFATAHRVLRPGGTLALADFVSAHRNRRGVRNWLGFQLGTLAWQIPPRNLGPIDDYVSQLRSAGFERIEAIDITQFVIPPFKRYLRPRLDQPPFMTRFHPLVRLSARLQIDLGFLDGLDYYVITAVKPSGPSGHTATTLA